MISINNSGYNNYQNKLDSASKLKLEADNFGASTNDYKLQRNRNGVLSGINFTSKNAYDDYKAPKTYVPNEK